MVDFLLGLRADVFAAAIYMISSLPSFSKINQDVSIDTSNLGHDTFFYPAAIPDSISTYEKCMVDISGTQVIKS